MSLSTLRNCSLALVLVFGLTARPVTAAPNPEAGKPIDLVICLDISGSMDGLIDSTKIKIWEIVNDLAKIKPTPAFRVSLYSYGCDTYDPKTGWIKKEIDLSTDLDEVYKKLNALKTNGGNEYHTGVAKQAIDEIKWSQDKDALKIIFVCGNEALAQDPVNRLEDVAALAKKNSIFINTIHCAGLGHLDDANWHRFATLTGGKGMNINQGAAGQEVFIASPFDKELNVMNDKLNKTYIAYGKKEVRDDKVKNQLAQDSAATENAPQANYARIQSKATGLYKNEMWDLCDRCKTDPKFDITKIPEDELPEELKKLKPDERVAYVKTKALEREEVTKAINKLNDQRIEFVAKEKAKQPKGTGDQAWDNAIRDALREQCKTKNIDLPK